MLKNKQLKQFINMKKFLAIFVSIISLVMISCSSPIEINEPDNQTTYIDMSCLDYGIINDSLFVTFEYRKTDDNKPAVIQFVVKYNMSEDMNYFIFDNISYTKENNYLLDVKISYDDNTQTYNSVLTDESELVIITEPEPNNDNYTFKFILDKNTIFESNTFIMNPRYSNNKTY